MQIFRPTGIAAIVAFTTVAAPSFAGVFECYADVHDGCFVNTNNPCTDEDYEGFLDECDFNETLSQRNAARRAAPEQPANVVYMNARQLAKLRNHIRRTHAPMTLQLAINDGGGNDGGDRSDAEASGESKGKR